MKQRFLQFIHKKPAEAALPADAETLAEERCHAVRSAVSRLPIREREAVVLFYLEGRSVTELSQILSTSPNTVFVRLHRAREKLAVSLRSVAAEDVK